MGFVRNISQEVIEALKQECLFKGYLLPDIMFGRPRGASKENSYVFPAVRNGRIDFYWAGGKLFSYGLKREFETHHKYASVLAGNAGDYIAQSALKDGRTHLITDFCEGYDRIKENCECYTGLEGIGVSSIYEKFSCVMDAGHPVVVLDIEASFAKDESSQQDRIDIVALDVKSGLIRFIEAKHYSYRGALRAQKGRVPSVVGQMKRYATQLRKSSEEILSAYKNHTKILNQLFGRNIPEPLKVDLEPTLFIFGFDGEQKGYLTGNIEPVLKENGVRFYCKGDVKDTNLATLFKAK